MVAVKVALMVESTAYAKAERTVGKLVQQMVDESGNYSVVKTVEMKETLRAELMAAD